MEIEIIRDNEVLFGELEVGDAFKDGSDYLIRIPNIKKCDTGREGAVYNAFSLKNCFMSEYSKDCPIVPVDAKLVVSE